MHHVVRQHGDEQVRSDAVLFHAPERPQADLAFQSAERRLYVVQPSVGSSKEHFTMKWKPTAKKAALSALMVLLIHELYDKLEARIESVPPPPLSVVLTCVTAGLPDLAVLCKFIPSQTEVQGYIDFGDGRTHKTIHQAALAGSAAKPSLGKQLSVEQDTAEGGWDPAVRLYWEYKEPGSYRVNLVLIGEDGSYTGAHQDVRVSRSEELEDEFRVRYMKVTAIGDDAKEQPKEVPVAYRLSVHNLIFYEERSYTVEVNPDPNWVLNDDCEFEKSSSRFASIAPDPNPKISRGVARFKFDLESSPFVSGSEDGYLYGTIKCKQLPEEAVNEVEKSEFSVDRLGITEVDLDNDSDSNPMVVNTKAGNWELNIDGTSLEQRPWNQDYVYGRVRIRLIDIPIIPPERRRQKLYLRIEPR